MFVNGIAYGAILLPALLALIIGLLILATFLVNRRHSPFGWLVPLFATVLVFAWYERDRNGETDPSSKGVVEFGMLSDIEDVLSQSTFQFPQSTSEIDNILFTGEVVDIRFKIGSSSILFPKVGGLSNSLLSINFRDHPKGISYASFGAQHTPLKLEDALARAKRIEAQLFRAGFVDPKQGVHCQRFQPIKMISSEQITTLKTWIEAERILRDARIGITEMNLFCLTGKTATVSLTLQNWARGHSSIYQHNFGREWGVFVEIES